MEIPGVFALNESKTSGAPEKVCGLKLILTLQLFCFDTQLRTFLNLLPSSEGDTDKFVADQPLEVSSTLLPYSCLL